MVVEKKKDRHKMYSSHLHGVEWGIVPLKSNGKLGILYIQRTP